MTIADAGYFRALGIPLLAGHLFEPTDPPRTGLVDEPWATHSFGSPEGAVGRRILHGGCTTPERCDRWTVQGAVGDVPYAGVSSEALGAVYLDAHTFPQRGAYLVVRVARGDPAAVLGGIRRIVHYAEPRPPVTSAATGGELLRESLRSRGT